MAFYYYSVFQGRASRPFGRERGGFGGSRGGQGGGHGRGEKLSTANLDAELEKYHQSAAMEVN